MTQSHSRPQGCAETPDAAALGQNVLGPIFAEFTLRLWLLLAGLEDPENTCALFCARGGLRLHYLFELFLQRTGLTCPVATGPLMVSRLIAVRAALLRRAPAAFDEIGREFAGARLGAAAAALAQAPPPAGIEWDPPMSRRGFETALFGTAPAAAELRHAIAAQHELFAAHLATASGGRRRIVLCDTGLFGSTVRLLAAAMPQHEWGCALLARCNYKGFAAEHFARTCGLAVESDRYSPLDPRTALLRYWHLVEAMLEPDLPSVTRFRRDGDGSIRSNLEIPGWRDRVPPQAEGLFAGVAAYIGGLEPGSFFATIEREAGPAWRALKRVVVFPRAADAARLAVGERSHDFGRGGGIAVIAGAPGAGIVARLRGLRRALWREGAVAGSFRRPRPLILAGIETVYAMRWAYRTLAERFGRGAAAPLAPE